MNNTIYIRRKRKVYLKKGDSVLSEHYALNLLSNIERLGFTLSPELLDVLLSQSAERFRSFYRQLEADLKELVGDSVEYKPMYPDFPTQVVEASESELFLNAYMHYLGDWIGRRILPDYEKSDRPVLADEIELKQIDLGTPEDYNSIFTRLLSSKTSTSEIDKADIEWYVKNYNEAVIRLVPDDIPHKENIAFYLSCLLKNDIEADVQMEHHLTTATDVLRIAVALSDGDISLATNTKFVSIPKRHRRLLMSMLEAMGNIVEDMLRYKGRWKRLGEILHPFEYKKRYPRVYEAFDILRNDKPFKTFNSRVEAALMDRDIDKALVLLRTRPGELARRLDHLLRISSQSEGVLSVFRELAGAVSTPVLLQMKTHFAERSKASDLRIFFPKGKVSSVMAIDDDLPVLSEDLCASVVGICDDALIVRFRKYKPLGKVYLDERLKDYTVPLSQRSASRALETLPRGSRVDLLEGDTIRFFIYWKDGSSRTDIDLSALALGEGSDYKMTIAYYNLKELGAYHSGDITSAPDGASEFIDLDIPTCLKQGIRYVMMIVNSYTWQAFVDLPICFAGIMMRQAPDSGEVYEPRTVKNKYDLTADTTISIPLIVDLVERKFIWTDLSLTRNPATNNNVHNNLSSTTLINKAMTGINLPNLYDLLLLHVEARGEETLDIEDADTIFAIDRGIKPTDIDILISDYL